VCASVYVCVDGIVKTCSLKQQQQQRQVCSGVCACVYVCADGIMEISCQEHQ